MYTWLTRIERLYGSFHDRFQDVFFKFASYLDLALSSDRVLGVVILLTELKARHTPIVIADGDDFEFTMDAVGEHWSLYGTCHHIDAMRPEVREMVQKTRRNTPARRQEDNPASALPVHDRNPFDTEGFM
ncbi:hypothetical protein E4U40_003404 [Claviceps sp. LM458 group G5]|nr:hypothetical protein E4U40_003404 [Claviceps sp. LM458 group G5]